MTYDEVMNQLQANGTAQNVKIYCRHGARSPLFGVSFANLSKLKKQIKQNHALALQLWGTGNMDAMTLALMVIDATQLDPEQVNEMFTRLNYYMLVDMFVSEVVMHQEDVKRRMGAWTRSKKEFVKRAGYGILTNLARSPLARPLTDKVFLKYLERIEADIHTAPNRAREMMNTAVLNIGLRNGNLHKAALDAALRIGKVTVDHGQTSCKTYDTPKLLADKIYLEKARIKCVHDQVTRKKEGN